MGSSLDLRFSELISFEPFDSFPGIRGANHAFLSPHHSTKKVSRGDFFCVFYRVRNPLLAKKDSGRNSRKKYRPLANVMEKLILERLRDLGYLDEKFQIKRKQGKG
jgi:hypothetical protein